jgi:hypothetical protein
MRRAVRIHRNIAPPVIGAVDRADLHIRIPEAGQFVPAAGENRVGCHVGRATVPDAPHFTAPAGNLGSKIEFGRVGQIHLNLRTPAGVGPEARADVAGVVLVGVVPNKPSPAGCATGK